MVSYDWTNGRSSCCHSARREVFIVFHCQVVSTSYIFSYLNFKFFIFAGKRESLGKLKWKQQRFNPCLVSCHGMVVFMLCRQLFSMTSVHGIIWKNNVVPFPVQRSWIMHVLILTCWNWFYLHSHDFFRQKTWLPIRMISIHALKEPGLQQKRRKSLLQRQQR